MTKLNINYNKNSKIIKDYLKIVFTFKILLIINIAI